MEISKHEFEQFLPVATSSHDAVYEKVEPAFSTEYDWLRENVLGTVGAGAVEGNERLEKAVKRWVALSAFLAVFRQMDLVLTPTGFGVVSNDQTAPASKMRTDALIGQLQTEHLRSLGELLTVLCSVDGWGETAEAQENIDSLFFDFRLMQKMGSRAASHLDWQAAQRPIAEADEFLRLHIGTAYMDALLAAVRTDAVSVDDRPVIFLCRHFINLWICGDKEGAMLKYRRLQNTLDTALEKYPLYAESAYNTNHYENFQNTEDAPAFVFNG